MDKNTLSNYGWIVIAVLVLSVMIALATPFGSYIENGVRSTTAGLFDTSEKAMNVVGMSAGDGSFDSDNSGTQTTKEPFTTLTAKTWDGLTSFYGKNVWTDGTNIYHSGNIHHILNGNTWKSKNWDMKGQGQRIWTDGTNIYYSYASTQLILNGDTWETKTWNELPNPSGVGIWTDGTNTYYYSNGSAQYVLNGDTWETKTWNISISQGRYVWTDGTNTYYSNGSDQYVLNGNTWETKVWNGLTNPSAVDIWTDGTNTYYSNGSAQYVLNGDTWEPKTWDGLTSFNGQYIWTDGTNYYYSNGTEQYVFS